MLKNIFLILFISILLSGCSNNNQNNETNNSNHSHSYTKTSTEVNDIDTSNNTNTSENNDNEDIDNSSIKPATEPIPPKEEEISVFTTKIYNTEFERQNNIAITSNKLNGTIVKAKSTFSFTNTVGRSKSNEGYKEADIFDKNGNKIKGLGGGNCQVSTTLYNAVLKISTLKVVERHDHSNKVPYAKKGKDAAVSYGSVDFKFRNDNDYDIKIYVIPTSSDLTVKLVKLI